MLTLTSIKQTVSYQYQLAGMFLLLSSVRDPGTQAPSLKHVSILLGVGAHTIFSVQACEFQLNFPSKWYGSLSLEIIALGVMGNLCPALATVVRPLAGRKPLMGHPQMTSLPCGLMRDWVTDQQAVYRTSTQVHIWGLKEAPVSALVVSDMRLHLVIHLLVCQEYPFDTCYLGKRARDGEPCWAKC